MRRHSLSAAVAAGFVVAAGLSERATAVELSPEGTGQVLIYPYYTVNRNQQTVISVVNAANVAKAVRVRFLEPWTHFPTDDALADTAAMNRWIEEEIRRSPAQYLWVHKRFKTRPAGEPSLDL